MNQYDELINQADMAVIDDTIVEPRIKIRLALEYVFWTIKILWQRQAWYVFVIKRAKSENWTY
jgi:hypothetical protein